MRTPRSPATRFWLGEGRTFRHCRGRPERDQTQFYTAEGAVEHDLHVLPGMPFPNPLPNYVLGVNLFW
jgi:hypothetical protein